MENPNLSMTRDGSTEIQLPGRAVRIQTSQVELLGRVLTQAFYNNAGVTYIFPDPEERRAVLPWFFTSVAIRAGRLCGEVFTTPNVDGGALWIRPGVDLTIGHAVRTEMLSLPSGLARSSIVRWKNLIGYLETARRKLAHTLHWYLLALGTGPSKTSIRAALMDPVLVEADWDLQPCYVETFDEKDLLFYGQRGFRITGAGQIPKGGPNFWTLIRPPRPALSGPEL